MDVNPNLIEAENAVLRGENDSLREKLNELQSRIEEKQKTQNLNEVANSAKQSGATLQPAGSLLAQRTLAISACGGLARFTKLTLDERLKAMGQPPATAQEIELARKLFSGKESLEASRVAKHNPGQYSRLRIISREL